MTRRLAPIFLAVIACAAPAPDGLMPTPLGSGATVKFDVYHRPLPEIPLPNDYATRFDPSSPSGLRVNASMIAPTNWETGTRKVIDALDGWGTFAPVSVSFSEPLDVMNIIKRHQHDDYDFSDDAVFLVNISEDSPDFCDPVPLDMGAGNFPLVLENQNFGLYTDTRYRNQQLLFDETNEDLNGNGKLDLGEDTDMDGVLDLGNFAHNTDGPFDVMPFYERETNTLIMKPVMPMRENTVYAAVITNRLIDESGRSVRSPFDYINHTQQTKALQPLKKCLGRLGLAMDDVAFTWSFTTQSITRDYKAVRDGLNGLGPMSRLQQQFPPEISNLFPLRRNTGPGESKYILTNADITSLTAKVIAAFNNGHIDAPTQAIIDSYKWVDYAVVGQFQSPQFFRRTNTDSGNYHLADDADAPGKPKWGTGKLARDAQGNLIDPPLPLYEQTFQLDPVTGAAFVRPETVTFWMTVPKGRHGKPAPVVFLGHGYTSSKIEAVAYAGYFAMMGFATIAVDCVSHGLDIDGTEVALARAEAQQLGYDAFFDAVALNDRAVDLDDDGRKDSGADFWTSYVLHTRDVVKQSAIDHMVLARLLKSFDGKTHWKYDVNKDGMPDLAGDFDGDGAVDVGGPASLHMTGGSLGGIMSAMMGGLEPAMETILPVSGGAGLSDVGVRSIQGGVKEAVNWRMFGPMLATQRDPMTHKLQLAEWVPDLNGRANLHVADFTTEPNEGDTVIVTNGKTGEFRCSRVHSDPDFGNSLIGVAVSSDVGDPLRLDIYAGPLPAKLPQGCDPTGATPTMSFDTLGVDVAYEGQTWKSGTPLVAFTDGFGLRRDSPETRRFMSIAQIALESGDPVNVAPFYERWLLKYGTGEEVKTRGMIINTIGDMNVPMATGVQIARAAGYIELFQKDARYGMTDNEVLIQHHALEAVERAGPYRNSQNQPVLMDIDHYSAVVPVDDGFDVPRLDPPLRLQKQSDVLGGYRGMMLPMVVPTGKHGFNAPDPTAKWNLGGFMFGTMGRFMQTDGKDFQIDKCSIDFTCSYFPQTVPN